MIASSVVRLVVVVAVVSLGGATVGIAGGKATASRATANGATFQDAVGEYPAGPDVTSVSVTNDDAGELTFRISIPSHPVLTEDLRIQIPIDYDDNAATGLSVNGGQGVDRVIYVDRGLYGLDNAAFGGCSGSTCAAGVDPSLLRFSYEQGVAVFSLDAGRVEPALKRLRFRVQVTSGSGSTRDLPGNGTSRMLAATSRRRSHCSRSATSTGSMNRVASS